jgi:hypothetical protein
MLGLLDVLGAKLGEYDGLVDRVGTSEAANVGLPEVVGRKDGGKDGAVDNVGTTLGARVGLLDTLGLAVGVAVGTLLTLGLAVISIQVKLAPSNTTQLSNILSPTSPTANLITFHLSASPYGDPCAVNVSVNPSASICGYGTSPTLGASGNSTSHPVPGSFPLKYFPFVR